MVQVYLALIVMNTTWQVAFRVVPIAEAASAVIVYALPVLFYLYFRKRASSREVRGVLWGIVAASLISGGYFVYESYLKLSFGQVTEYADLAFRYSVTRSGLGEEALSTSRIATNYRAFGLLEAPAVSGTWLILGAMASLALLSPARRLSRRLVIALFGAMLLLALNFTTILAFVVIIFVTEIGGLDVFRGRLGRRPRRAVFRFVAGVLVVGFLALVFAGQEMADQIRANLTVQRNLLFGTGDAQLTMFTIMLRNIGGYATRVSEMPWSVVIGDGFTSYGGAKGGDIGFVETLGRYGVPFFTAVVVGWFRLIRSGTRQLRVTHSEAGSEFDPGMVRYAVGILWLVAITEGHYTVWSTKSVLPCVFFGLALFERYSLPSRRAPAAALNRVS